MAQRPKRHAAIFKNAYHLQRTAEFTFRETVKTSVLFMALSDFSLTTQMPAHQWLLLFVILIKRPYLLNHIKQNRKNV
jgi:hypothetical protein